MAVPFSVPLAHAGHWAVLLYAAPLLLLLIWAGVARLRKWWSSKRKAD